jgi:signal transduction histidine kinase
MENLIINAIQAMEKSGGTLTVTLDTLNCAEVRSLPAGKQAAAEYALIRFADTGPGMDETTAARMFEPFFTAGKQGMGTGLGLSVVYGIISAIDGEIRVTTKEGRGTVIELLIPSLC